MYNKLLHGNQKIDARQMRKHQIKDGASQDSKVDKRIPHTVYEIDSLVIRSSGAIYGRKKLIETEMTITLNTDYVTGYLISDLFIKNVMDPKGREELDQWTK